jgi:hypothetical protein
MKENIVNLIDKISTAWEHAKSARQVWIADDPNPVYSRLDRMDGLR